MLLDEREVMERFESPLNLLNRLKAGLTPHNHKPAIASIPPTADKIVEDLEEKLKHGGLKSKAASIMDECLTELKNRVGEVQKVEKLAAVAETMNKIVNAENKNKNDDTQKPQFIVYSPTFIKEEHFDTIYAKE